MKLSYNENGVLAGCDWLTYPMCVLNLCLITLVPFRHHSQYVYIATFVIGAILANMVCIKAWNETEYFEWDKRELLKSKKYIIRYSLPATFFSYLFTFYIASAIDDIYLANYYALYIDIPILLFYCFNLLYIPYIYYGMFEDILKMTRDIKEKPKEWDSIKFNGFHHIS